MTRPKIIRFDVLDSVAKFGITPLDDLVEFVGEHRKKVQDCVRQAVTDGLLTRTQDGAGVAYQITSKGRNWLKDHQAPQGTAAERAQAVALDVLESSMPGFTAEVVAQKDAEIARLTEALRKEEGTSDSLSGSLSVEMVKTIELAKQRDAWREVAAEFGCSTPAEILYLLRTNGAAKKQQYILGKMIREDKDVYSTIGSAKEAAVSLCNQDGSPRFVYAVEYIGMAKQVAEWKEEA